MTSVERSAAEISIGVLAWNEEDVIETTLESLFQQSLFAELSERNLRCEIICVANGCTDNTLAVAAKVFARAAAQHPFRNAFTSRVANIPERGKPNAWNVFVHELSNKKAKFLFVVDADILISEADTLWNVLSALWDHAQANVAVDRPLKDIAFKPSKSVLDRLSLATSRMTQADGVQLSGQLYCIRAEVARRIYLPRDLLVEDGFIKALICTDSLTRRSNPSRIVQATNAAHVFEAYRSIGAVLKNQKRQMIGQTMLHLLLDKELKGRECLAPPGLAALVREYEKKDPLWLRRMIGAHLQETKYFWRLFPGILSFRFKRLAKMPGMKKFLYLPPAILGFMVTLVSCWMAHRFLKRGYTEYWPDTKSASLKNLSTDARADRAQLLAKPAL